MADQEPTTGQQLRQGIAIACGIVGVLLGLGCIALYWIEALAPSGEARPLSSRLVDSCFLATCLLVWTAGLLLGQIPRRERIVGLLAVLLMAPLVVASFVMELRHQPSHPTTLGFAIAGAAVVGLITMCVIGVRGWKREKAKRRAKTTAEGEGGGRELSRPR
jgi:hypothetical protein